MRRSLALLIVTSSAFFCGAALLPAGDAEVYDKEIRPSLVKFCGPCHGSAGGPGGFSLASGKKLNDLQANHPTWEKVASALRKGIMPPPNMPQPTKEERLKLAQFIERILSDCVVPSPGRVTMRRLNRAEYNNTIRDLLMIEFRPADDFPSDEVGYGFDNIGDVLSLSPLLMEKYLKAAEQAASKAIYVPTRYERRVSGDSVDVPNSGAVQDGARMLYANSELRASFDLPVAADYKVKVRAWQMKAGPDDAQMSIRLNGKDLQTFAVQGDRNQPQTFEVTVSAPAGRTNIGAAFLNDYYQADLKQDRNLTIMFIEVAGPLGAPKSLPTFQTKFLGQTPSTAEQPKVLRKVLKDFAGRAYRRPATEGEVDSLVRIANLAKKDGEPFERCLQLGITAALASPNFLFRVENGSGGVRDLNSYELASRLSYFLWSTMPDDELFSLAQQDKLRDAHVLADQVERMLKDPRTRSLADNFAAQWLQTRKLASVVPDKKTFPSFDNALRTAMATETEMFFRQVVAQDRSLLEFIDSDYTYLNETLARFYGIGGVSGSQFRRVQLPDRTRGGVLTQASVLTVTSNPTRTSPVKRGKWVLENILDAAPPPPPPNVGVLPEDRKTLESATVRELLEEHRKDPTCASCHRQMDGLGFALENFDAIGGWRMKDGKLPIDSSGELPDGSKFSGPAELKKILLQRKDEFILCMADKMLTYALGRGMTIADGCHLDSISKSVTEEGFRFSALVRAVVLSEPFRKQGVERVMK